MYTSPTCGLWPDHLCSSFDMGALVKSGVLFLETCFHVIKITRIDRETVRVKRTCAFANLSVSSECQHKMLCHKHSTGACVPRAGLAEATQGCLMQHMLQPSFLRCTTGGESGFLSSRDHGLC